MTLLDLAKKYPRMINVLRKNRARQLQKEIARSEDRAASFISIISIAQVSEK